jgi:hypothetical protein
MDIDLSTPEKALHLLEHAYRERDLELAMACRNFGHEAELMLHHLARKQPTLDVFTPETQSQLAEVLEAQWKQAGPPDFNGVSSEVSSVEHYLGKFHIATESGRHADGTPFSQRLFMSHQDGRWAVLCPASVHESP